VTHNVVMLRKVESVVEFESVEVVVRVVHGLFVRPVVVVVERRLYTDMRGE